jgi:beta-glucosidase
MTSSIEQQLNNILSQMKLDEKIAQLGSYWIYELQTKGELDQNKVADKLKDGIGQITRVAGASMLDPVTAAKVGNKLQKYLVEETRLGIPAILHEECCSGTMVLGGTMYPQIIGLTSTFRPELAEAMTSAIRKQMLAIGARQALAPVLDIARDPRWGRVEETFGEDPTLASQFGVSYIRGLQGETLAEGVIATGKHFVGHSLSSGGLNCGPVQMGKNDINNVLLAPFQAAIRDAGLASIMNAYPELDGEVVAASRRILTDLLRNELGFDGIVVSDYEAVTMIHNYHYAAPDKSTAARMALKAGIDVELPSIDCYGGALKAAVDAGEVSVDTVDFAARRHLRKKFELGLFDNPYVEEGNVIEVFKSPNNRALAKKIARQSMVLLNNDGLLPLNKKIKTLAVIGPNADNGRNQLGDYSFAATKELLTYQAQEDSAFVDIDEAQISRHEIVIITILAGIKAAVSPETDVLYGKGCEVLGGDRSGFEEAIEIAINSDAVVLVLGDRSGLVPNCTSGETRDSADLRLPGLQEELAKAIISTGVPVVVVLVNGRPYAIPWLDENANAILEAWLPGQEGGNAVADVLFGNTNPGGKLPITFPRAVGQVPIFYNAKPSGNRSNWYVDYVAERVAPLYHFGHGLSYTTFEYGDLIINKKQATIGESVDISLVVTNTGPVEGDEVVQLYIHDEFAITPRPVKELKGFIRLTLQPGERKNITFHLPVDQLAFYDNELNLVIEPGRIYLMLGSSSDDIRLKGEFTITGQGMLPIKERVFVCPVEIN